MEKQRAKLLMPTVMENDDAKEDKTDIGAGSNQSTVTEQGATMKHKSAVLGGSKLATWNLLKRKISFTVARKGVHMGSSVINRSRQFNSISSASKHAGPKMENTYQMTPARQAIFKPACVHKEIADVLEGVLGNMEYNPVTSGRITSRLSEAIKTRIKALQLQRHKLVVQVVVGSHSGQSLEMASRCLWNQETDNFATASYQNTTLFAIASVYGIYFE